jgi:type II secretory pathway pseudopilin PulG
MNLPIILELRARHGWACRRGAMEIDGATGKSQNARHKGHVHRTAGFSLVELTLAIGVAAFCLITVFALLPVALKTQQASIQQTTANNIITEILGDLRADVRLPPGQASKEGNSGFGLHGHWLAVAQPDTLFFSNDAQLVSPLGQPYSGDPTPPPCNANSPSTCPVFRAKITYQFPPNASTAVAKVFVSWPAQAIPGGTPAPAGQVETFIAINR